MPLTDKDKDLWVGRRVEANTLLSGSALSDAMDWAYDRALEDAAKGIEADGRAIYIQDYRTGGTIRDIVVADAQLCRELKHERTD